MTWPLSPSKVNLVASSLERALILNFFDRVARPSPTEVRDLVVMTSPLTNLSSWILFLSMALARSEGSRIFMNRTATVTRSPLCADTKPPPISDNFINCPAKATHHDHGHGGSVDVDNQLARGGSDGGEVASPHFETARDEEGLFAFSRSGVEGSSLRAKSKLRSHLSSPLGLCLRKDGELSPS